MGDFFQSDNAIWSSVGKIADILWLSILWVVCSIPIITIGPATTALNYVCLKLAKDEEGYVTKQFFRSFKENFKQGLGIGLIMTVWAILLVANVYFYRDMGTTIGYMMYVITFMLIWMYLILFIYVFAVLAQFDNTVRRTFLVAFVLAIKNFGWTMLMIVILVGVLVLGFFVFIPVLLIAPGAIAMSCAHILNRIFRPYIAKAQEDEQPSE